MAQLSYEEFREKVPYDTREYVDAVLSYLYYYIVRGNNVQEAHSQNKYVGDVTKMVASCLLALDGTKYDSFIKQRGYKREVFDLHNYEKETRTSSLKEAYNRAGELFEIYVDSSRYKSLLPVDILVTAIKLRNRFSETSGEDINNFYNTFFDSTSIRTETEKYASDLHRDLDIAKEKEIFGSLSYEVVYYLETAAKIRQVLLLNFYNKKINEDIIPNNDSALVPVSLLLAFYEYDGDEKNAIENYFETIGLPLNTLKKYLEFDISKDIKKAYVSFDAIKEHYLRYINSGKNSGTSLSNIKIIDVIANLFNRQFTNSMIIEKILNDLGIKTNIIEGCKNIGVPVVEEKEKSAIEAKEFAKSMRKDTKEFIYYCCKIYQLLITKMKEGKHNTDILEKEDDADTLAVYITAHYYHKDIDDFYSSYNVTYEKVLELLGISIKPEEINSIEIDNGILLSRFKRFVVDGINSKNKIENVTISDVVHNLCNKDFNKSNIMIDIFESINPSEKLDKDFFSRLTKYLEDVAAKEKRRKMEEYFKDFPIENIKYLTNLSIIFKKMLGMNLINKYGLENCKVLALIAATFSLDESILKDFFKAHKLYPDKIDNYIPEFTSDLYKVYTGELDTDILTEYFNDYVFEGFNKNIPKKDIRVFDIATNAFNENIHQSVFLKKLYADISFDSKSFTEGVMKIEYTQYSGKIQKQKEINEYLSELGSENQSIAKKALDYYQLYSDTLDGEKLEVLSLILAYIDYNRSYYHKTNFKFISDRGLETPELLSYFNIKEKKYKESSDTIEAFKHLKKYIGENSQETLLNMMKTNTFIDICKKTGISIDETIEEVKTGKKFIESLTIETAIELLEKLEVEPITLENISTYGNNLAKYQSYLNYLYNPLINSKEVETSTSNVKETLNQMQIEDKQNEDLLEGIFALLRPRPIEQSKVQINQNTVTELQEKINKSINFLKSNEGKYRSLIIYFNLLEAKNFEYLKNAIAYQEKIENGSIKLEASFGGNLDEATLNSIKATLSRKIDLLKQSQSTISIQKLNLAHQMFITSNYIMNLSYTNNLFPEIILNLEANNQIECLDSTRDLLKEVAYIVNNAGKEQKEILTSLGKYNDSLNLNTDGISDIEVEAVEVEPSNETKTTEDQVIKLTFGSLYDKNVD